MYYLLPLLFLSMLYSTALCQEKSFNPGFPLKDLTITQWTSEEGLSSNNLTSVFQDSDGLLWITSFNGFMTFDGERFETFDKNKLPFLETDGFYAALQNVDGSILLGSQGSGLVRYELGEFSPYIPKLGRIPKSIRSLLLTKSGDILIGASNAGLFQLRNDTITIVQHDQLLNATVMAMVEDQTGTIWVGTDGDGLFALKDNIVKRFTRAEGLPSNNIEALAINPAGTLIIGTGQGIVSVDHDRTRFVPFQALSNNHINALWVDEWSSIWIGTERGLARYNATAGAPEQLVSKNDIDFVRITEIVKDKEGNLWVTSNRSGLIRLRETNITNIQLPVISSNRVNIVHEAPSGRMYIGTDANQIDICEDNHCKPLLLKTSVDGNGVRDILEESKNSIWLATYSGIIHIQNGKEIVYSTAQGMPAEDFRVILKDRQGNLWFGSRSGGLVKFRNGKIEKIYGQKNGLESNYVMAVTEVANGDIYVGTHSGGMTVISPNGETRTYHLRDDDAGILLFNIDEDKQGRIWVMANTGPVFFDGDSLKSIALQHDTRGKTYFDWVDDEQGSVWITTSIGVIQLEKNALVEHIARGKGEMPYLLVDDKDGMGNKECTGATRSILSSSGKIYIPTLGGVCIINPKEKRYNSVIPTIRISRFATDTIRHNPAQDGQRIKAGTLRYSFRFSSLSFSAPERNRFRYQLEGLDKDWSAPVSNGEVEYTNLPPGTYTFRVIGSNDNNLWNEKGASLTFHVSPFFYQTIWFYVLLAALVSGILFSLYKWRITIMRKQNEALKKVNTELDRFVYSASHDLRSPLASIMGLINVARKDNGAVQVDYLSLIEKSVVKLDSFISDIIDFSRNARLEVVTEPIDFETMLKDVFDDLRFLEQFEKIQRSVFVRTSRKFHSDPKRVRIILSNLIANAIKHHFPAQRNSPGVSITVDDDKTGIIITVTDNGPGIEEKYLNDIFKMFFRATNRTPGSGLGLYIVEETVSKLHGTIAVSSTLGEGTTFTVKLPDLQ